jgi:hypothetical protein
MALQVMASSYAVVDFCAAIARGEIQVNRDYQRSPEVWPQAARSFLVETILLGYPMPKLSLYQLTDVKSRKVTKEIVDGQQRSMAICDYFNDAFPIAQNSGLVRARGRRYSELDDDLKDAFLDYPVQVDLFLSATRDEIIDVFRRINSYTVPLNPEEQRHAVFQGKFKWFIYRLSAEYGSSLVTIGAFSESQLVRMADTKLYSEICHALEFGITTTNRRRLDALYKSKDECFPEEEAWEDALSGGLDWLIGTPDLYRSGLLRPYHLYSLLLAWMACSGKARGTQIPCETASRVADREDVARGLTRLAAALASETPDKRFDGFLKASESKTNVAAQRKERFRWYCLALGGELA